MVVWGVCRAMPAIPARFQAWLWRLVMLKFLIALCWAAPIELPLLPAAPRTILTSSEAAAVPSSLIASAPMAVAPTSVLITPQMMIMSGWILLVSWQLGRIVAAWRFAQQLKQSCHSCQDPQLLSQYRSIGKLAGMRRLPLLLETAGEGSPLLLSWLRPMIVLPSATLKRLNTNERALVLGHELAHARRGDLFWSFLAAVTRALFCFHPLLWLGERRLDVSQEMAADELAIALQRQDPIGYATQLVSIVSKLGSRKPVPALAAGTAGPHDSLKQRLSAMRFVQPLSRPMLVGYGLGLLLIAALGMVPWKLVAADSPAVAKAPVAERSGSGRGRFVSLQDGVLTLEANDGALLKNKLPADLKVFRWVDGSGFQPAETQKTLSQIPVGGWVHILFDKGEVSLRVGSRKDQTVGTFVSFKENRLLILGKNLGGSFTKKYGNQVHFQKFRDDVVAYESIDGGVYQSVGPANQVLGNMKEGTIITVHAEGDSNITRVEIGVPKKS